MRRRGCTTMGRGTTRRGWGRWTAADPLGIEEPGQADYNVYAYVEGQPTVQIDPRGTDGFRITLPGDPKLNPTPDEPIRDKARPPPKVEPPRSSAQAERELASTEVVNECETQNRII